MIWIMQRLFLKGCVNRSLYIMKDTRMKINEYQELDKEHLAKKLGDVAWYLAEASTALDISLEDIFQANIDKLKMRYPDGFETKKSLVRLKGDI